MVFHSHLPFFTAARHEYRSYGNGKGQPYSTCFNDRFLIGPVIIGFISRAFWPQHCILPLFWYWRLFGNPGKKCEVILKQLSYIYRQIWKSSHFETSLKQTLFYAAFCVKRNVWRPLRRALSIPFKRPIWRNHTSSAGSRTPIAVFQGKWTDFYLFCPRTLLRQHGLSTSRCFYKISLSTWMKPFWEEACSSETGRASLSVPMATLSPNHHVVKDADEVDVMLNDNREQAQGWATIPIRIQLC